MWNKLAYLCLEENWSRPRAFMHAPQDDFTWDTLGYVLLKNGRIDQRARMLNKASESSPKNLSILYHLDLAYKASRDSSKTMQNLQKALAVGEFHDTQDATALQEKINKN